MSRYIDTDEFEKRIKPYDTDDCVDKAMYNFAHNIMLCTSTADVVKRKRGKWIGKPIAGYSNIRCSNCNNVYLDNSGKWNYCPNCGAQMNEEKAKYGDFNIYHSVHMKEE